MSEADASGALAALSELGVLSAIDAGAGFDGLTGGRALALLPEDGRADLLLMASLLLHRRRTDRTTPSERCSRCSTSSSSRPAIASG